MVKPSVVGVDDNAIPGEMFGGNILATRDGVGPDDTYPVIADALGVEQIRYPGGALTETYFDISNPDNDQVTDVATGETIDFLPMSEFMGWAEETDRAVTLVLPTRTQLSEDRDANGERFAAVEEEELRGFLRDTLDGAYGDPELQAIEIGNEYWGSGEMSSTEYGRVASEMARIVDEELTAHPRAERFEETDILVQSGKNFDNADLQPEYGDLGSSRDILDAIEEDYGVTLDTPTYEYLNGEVAWPRVADALIRNEFDATEAPAIDDVVTHLYSKGPENQNSRYFELETIDITWQDDRPELDTYVTEWNRSASTDLYDRGEDYGLDQAHELLNTVEAMGLADVEAAHVWPLQQNTASTLGGEVGETELTPAGALFAEMQAALPGTRAVDLKAQSRETETSTDDGAVDVHMFAAPDRMVAYLANTRIEAETAEVDLSNLISDPGAVTLTRIGVGEGEDPDSTESRATVTENPEGAAVEGTTLSADLDPREILQVTFDGPEMTESFAGAVAEASGTEPPPEEDPPEDDDGGDEGDGGSDGGSDGGLGAGVAALLLLPLLALAGGG
ncbi:type I secretion protein [Rhodosalinus sediminis]|uniref:type I secretion protein n=1 Tax=Rhodosalinus sediminis TaxID=1940533 RepID=UPI002354ECC5|nr:type I secretion protein [Rhodosalinus sediminis]